MIWRHNWPGVVADFGFRLLVPFPDGSDFFEARHMDERIYECEVQKLFLRGGKEVWVRKWV